MSGYMLYKREEFENQLRESANAYGLNFGDFSEKMGTHKFEERVYEMTTKNPNVRILIYSSLDPRTDKSREVGGDAVRVNFYCSYKGELKYKKYKKHQRIETLFKNLHKTIGLANDFSESEDIKKWIYAIKKN